VTVHTLLVQSPGPPQPFPVAHAPQVAPPQSTSVSAPFFTLSVHVGAWHVPPAHDPLAQSVLSVHVAPTAHGEQPGPQSTSASLPFFTLSVQVGAWQTEPVQTRFLQSLGDLQAWPPLHGGHVAPPQSTSVSVPFRTKSVQVAV